MCDVLQVSRSGFYAWRERPASERSQRHAELISEMKQIHSEYRKDVYGSPRMHLELVDRGFAISAATVAKLPRQAGLADSTHPRFRDRTTNSKNRLPVA